MKKLVAIGVAVLVLALVAGPAMAVKPCPGCGGSDDLNIVNSAYVTNTVNSQASTGYISLSGMKKPKPCGMSSSGGLVFTGDASAYSEVFSQANYVGVGCDCVDGDINIVNSAYVTNTVNSQASSGYVRAGSGWVMTGNAAAGSLVTNLVNTVMVGYTAK